MNILQLETYAWFQCPKCGAHASDTIVLPESPSGVVDRLTDQYGENEARLECQHCGESFDADIYRRGASCTVKLLDYPATNVQTSGLRYEDPKRWAFWDDYEVPTHPFGIFLDSYRQVAELLSEHGGEKGTDLVNRMVFAQQVSAFEAYLGDTLVNQVLKSTEAIGKLLTQDKNLKGSSFTLSEISANPNLVDDSVKAYLKGVLYHRLESVDFLYKTALGISIWPDSRVKSDLFKSIAYRHDCVHRNGYDKQGHRLGVFTREYVQGISDDMKLTVENIQTQLS
jgi:hypothetical protein